MTEDSSHSGTGGRPTIWDVAKAAGVSIATVSNALNGKGRMSEVTRKRVLEVAEKLNYTPRPLGPGTATRRYQVALLIEEQSRDPHHDAFLAEVIQGIEQVVHGHDYDLAIEVVPPGSVRNGELPDVVRGDLIQGLMVLEGGDISDTYIKKLLELGLPVLLVDNFLYDWPVHCVTLDSVTGAYLATRHLLELGHRRIGIIRGPQKYKPLVERYVGYVMALDEYGISLDPDLAPPCRGGGRNKGCAEALSLLNLPNPPTAIFAVSDKTAFNVLKVIRSQGLRVPQDISLVGFDDLPAARTQNPPLTTVRIPKRKLGHVAAERMFNLIDYPGQPPHRISMPVELVVRQSSSHPAI